MTSTFNSMYSTVSTCNTKLLLHPAAPTVSKEKKYMACDGKLQVWLLELGWGCAQASGCNKQALDEHSTRGLTATNRDTSWDLADCRPQSAHQPHPQHQQKQMSRGSVPSVWRQGSRSLTVCDGKARDNAGL